MSKQAGRKIQYVHVCATFLLSWSRFLCLFLLPLPLQNAQSACRARVTSRHLVIPPSPCASFVEKHVANLVCDTGFRRRGGHGPLGNSAAVRGFRRQIITGGGGQQQQLQTDPHFPRCSLSATWDGDEERPSWFYSRRCADGH